MQLSSTLPGSWIQLWIGRWCARDREGQHKIANSWSELANLGISQLRSYSLWKPDIHKQPSQFLGSDGGVLCPAIDFDCTKPATTHTYMGRFW